MKDVWFRRAGWLYLPASVPGSVPLLPALTFCAPAFVAVDIKSHSVSDTFYGVFPFFAGAFLLFDWIAGQTSDQ